MKPLSKSFFKKDTISVARNLLGKYLVLGKKIGKIVETEAYLINDPASHSFNGKTIRNSPMFGDPAHSYIYFTYGMHHCFNITTNKKGLGEAVLIRAIEPIKGLEEMKKSRRIDNIKNLCNGPAKLTQAFELTKSHNNLNLLDKNSPLKIMKGEKEKFKIIKTKRIGVKKGSDLNLRFYIDKNLFISKLR